MPVSPIHDTKRSVGIMIASLCAAFFVAPLSAFAVTDIDSSRYIVRSTIFTEPSAQSGAFEYQYPLEIPAGRQGVQPSLVLHYSSGNSEQSSMFGFGWSLSVPSIQRIAKHGTDELYTRHDFTSSLSGELSDISLSDDTHGTFGAKVDDGSMLQYTYSTDETWSVVDKAGTTYTFGADAYARVADPADASHVYRWMLTSIVDIAGNTVAYTYTSDGAQAYLASINYTGFNGASGMFDVDVTLASRDDVLTSYASGFPVTTAYRVSDITLSAQSQVVRSYAFAYEPGDDGVRSLLSRVTETATTEDGTSSLTKPATTFTYAEGNSAWSSSSISFPETIAGYFAGSLGVYLFDMNGDGITDIVKSRDTDRAIYTGNADGTWTLSTVTPPIALSTSGGGDMGVRVMDMNGDGALDLVYARELSTGALSQAVYVNNNDGTGWTESATASVPIAFTTDGGANIGVEVLDVDGDGLPDIVKSRESQTQEVYINAGDGTGWSLASGYTVPVYFTSLAGVDLGVRTMDVNADGLVDLVYSRYVSDAIDGAVYLNAGDGTGWTEDPSWSVPEGFNSSGTDFGVRAADVNADGLVDLVYHRSIDGAEWQAVYVNTGTGWVADADITTPLSFAYNGLDVGVRIDDVDADGVLDFLKSRSTGSDTANELYLATGTVADMLTSVVTSTGASIAVTYGSSVNGENTSVPFVLQVVEEIETDDGLGNTATKLYTYADGDYYYASEFDRKFAGFGAVTATESDGVTTAYFHQGNETNSSEGESTDSVGKIGQQYREERTDLLGNLYRTNISTWDSTNLGTDRDMVYRSQILELLYGGTSTHTDSATTFAYDSTGNLIEQYAYGTVVGTDNGTFTDLGTDTRITRTTYATDSAGIVRNAPSQSVTYDALGTTVAESLMLYDGLSFGEVSEGSVTTAQQWISGSSYATTAYTYDAYGNVLTTTAPNGEVSTVEYESVAQQYPGISTNPLGQATITTYAQSLGKPTSVTGPNGDVLSTAYDAFGRPVLEERSSDTSVSTMVTTKTWEYDDTSLPRSVTLREYLSSTVYKETTSFLDGFDRTIQTVTLDAAGTGYNVSRTTYDDAGRVASVSLPEAALSSAYDSASGTSALEQVFSYDALSRVTRVDDALGSTSTAYDGLTKTVTDALGNAKSYTTDGLGRLVSVEENISGVPYTTSYTYSATDALTGITDSMGNVRALTYDGRNLRLSAEDLHAPTDTTFGTWTFAYDTSGNLSTSFSPRGDTTTYTYDALNRVVTEDTSTSAGTDVTYTYDSCTYGEGRLCTATSSDGTLVAKTYTVDGQVASETKTIAGTAYTTNTTYDYAGNPLTLTHPDGTIVRNTYNAIGALATVEEQSPSDVGYTSVVSAFTYGPDGQLTEHTNGNGTVTTNTYDAAHRYQLTQKVTTGIASEATTTSAPTTVTFYPSAGDGQTYKSNASWDTAHDATSGSASGAGTTALVGTGKSTTSYVLYRGLLPFDTSALPDDATITSATLQTYVNARADADDDGDDFITVVQSTQASATALASADYGRTGATNNPTEGVDIAERKDITSISSGTWITFTFNTTGQGFVSTTGTTNLALREGHDVLDSAFTSSSTTTAQYNYVGIRTGEYSGTTYDPVLTVTYTTTTTTPETGVTLQDLRYTYDAAGNIASIVDASDQVTAKTTAYTYDDLYRLTEEVVTGAANGENGTITYTYDALGNILSRSDLGVYSYDGDTGVSYANPHAVTSILKTDGATQTFTYDENGNVTSDGASSYTWDDKNRLIASETTTRTTTTTSTTVTFYPSAGDGQTYKSNASWDTAHDATSGSGASGTGTSVITGTGKTTTNYLLYRDLFPFDTSSLPDDATITSASLQLYVTSKLNHDNDGDDFITVVQSTQASATALASADYGRTGATNNPTEGIDTTERKDITSIATGAWLTFTLNATGQGFISPTGTTNLALREGHDVLDSAFTSSSTTTSKYNYVYFRTSEYAGTTYDPVLTVTYTESTETTALANTVVYTYDAFDARVSKTVTDVTVGTTATTVYPSAAYALEGTVSTIYIGGPAGISLASLENEGTTSSTLSTIATDHLGSAAVLSDTTGAMTELLDYHGYGNSRLTSGSATAKKTFIGQYTDTETTLSYLNARYYNPTQGQFLSEDSVFLGMGTNTGDLFLLLSDPQSQNSYGYARDNPINFSDPTGESWLTGLQGFAVGAATAFAVGVAVGAVIATLPISGPTLAVMAVVGGVGTVAAVTNSVISTNQAYESGAITADQRDYQYGNVVGNIVGGVTGGVVGSRVAAGVGQGSFSRRVQGVLDDLNANSDAPIPTQDYLNVGKVQEYYQQLTNGEGVAPIEVMNNGNSRTILDGHHRYVAGEIAGVKIDTVQMGTGSLSGTWWDNIKLND